MLLSPTDAQFEEDIGSGKTEQETRGEALKNAFWLAKHMFSSNKAGKAAQRIIIFTADECPLIEADAGSWCASIFALQSYS